MSQHPATAHVLTVLAVTDVERAVGFYTSALGWRVLEYWECETKAKTVEALPARIAQDFRLYTNGKT